MKAASVRKGVETVASAFIACFLAFYGLLVGTTLYAAFGGSRVSTPPLASLLTLLGLGTLVGLALLSIFGDRNDD